MARMDPTAVRFTADERRALDGAALEHSITISALIRWIVGQWLRKNGWLKSGKND